MSELDKILEEEVADVPTSSDQPLEISEEAGKADEELKKIASTDENKVLKTASLSKKVLLAVLFIAVNLLAILITVLMEFTSDTHPVNISEVWDTIMENWVWGAAGIGLFVLTILFQALKRHTLMYSTLKKKKIFLLSLNSTVLCKYYDNITPLGSGGQPFEIYYLRKKGVPVGIASGVPIVGYAIDRIAYVIITLATILIYGFGSTNTAIKILCLVGLSVNALIPCAIFFFTVMPKVANATARFVGKIAKLFKLTKDADGFSQKFVGSMTEYADCIKYFMHKSKRSMLQGFVYSALYFISLYLVPYCSIRMCGFHSINVGEIFALCVICYTSVTLIPTPGNSGGAELSFRSIFRSYLSGGLLFWGMMSWRLLSFYSYIIVGIILIIIQQVYKLIASRKQDPVQTKSANKADAEMRQKIKDATLPFNLDDNKNNTEQPQMQETAISESNESEVDEDLTYVLPTKATANIEAEELTADTIIETEATIEEEPASAEEEVIDIDTQLQDAETVAEVEVVIEGSNKVVIVDAAEREQSENKESNENQSSTTENTSQASETVIEQEDQNKNE